MTAVRAEIKAINRINLAQEVREQKLKEAQQMAEIVLDSEVRLGELMASLPKAKNQYESAIPIVGKSKKDTLNELGFSTSKASALKDLGFNRQVF